MYKNNKDLTNKVLLVAATAVISFGISVLVFAGWLRVNPPGITFDNKSVSKTAVSKFNSVREILKSQYYENVDDNTLIEGAISGMAGAMGDRYTSYFSKDKWQMFQQDLTGSFVGIGVMVHTASDGLLTVMEVFEGSPAKAAGVLPGDKVVKVDGKDVSDEEEDTIIKMIKGKEGTEVQLAVLRPSESNLIELHITRRRIKEENINSRMLSDNIGYIRIIKFDSEIARYFKDNIDSLTQKGMRGLVIDVRDNPGGYYNQVVSIADMLLPKCTIVYTEDKDQKKEYKYSDAKQLNMPVIVLVNGNSASASEILAGAIKDNKRGTLVGTRTYGKGLVQASFNLEDGSGLKVTVQRYFTPSGVCIQGKGIDPDIEVLQDEKYRSTPVSNIPQEDDLQLSKALELAESELRR
ncbi:carboxyl-terminal processing protease [Anaerobacterium chartisolvens]|uniref:Carboxyl-terminal processing protease n=1 Tax=Anaerobacterium chartisolvens TaxID=1297424 RepID=A0A369B9X7_9FIRM|nr:carboxyl-terminal processing protease [Anaerobacterium chartisolvens]